MPLNPQNRDLPYVLGRLLSVLFPPNVSIADAKALADCVTEPGKHIGPLLVRKRSAEAETIVAELVSLLPPALPARLSPEEMSYAWIGYYHQRAVRLI